MTFLIKIGGKITCANNDTFTFHLRLNYKPLQPQLPSPILATFNITSNSVLTNTPWDVEAICSLRDLGATATMFTDARFSYFESASGSQRNWFQWFNSY